MQKAGDGGKHWRHSLGLNQHGHHRDLAKRLASPVDHAERRNTVAVLREFFLGGDAPGKTYVSF
jgi:hypothetical protein